MHIAPKSIVSSLFVLLFALCLSSYNRASASSNSRVVGIVNAADHCRNHRRLDYSCLSNSLADNTFVEVPTGTYSISSALNISQSNVTIQCEPGAVLQVADTKLSPMMNITGHNIKIDGCIIDDNNVGPAGASSTTVYVNGATGVTLTHMDFRHSQNSTVSVASSNTIDFENNTLEPNPGHPSGAFQAYSAVYNLNVANLPAWYGPVSITPANNGTGSGKITVSNVNCTLQGGSGTAPQFCFSAQDVSSGLSAPVNTFLFSNVTCTITDTTQANPMYGCFTIVNSSTTGTIDGATMNTHGQFITIGLIELGGQAGNITVSNFTADATDTHNQQYSVVVSYYENNNIGPGIVTGFAQNGACVQITALGPADGNYIHNVKCRASPGSTTSSIGFSILCTQAGAHSNNNVLVGNYIDGGATNGVGYGWAMNDAANGGTGNHCPVGGYITNQTTINATNGYFLQQVHPIIGELNSANVTYKSSPFYGGSTITPASFPAGIQTTVSTISALPAATTVEAGTQLTVSDSATFTPGTCTGGGANYMIAVSNGKSWSCH